MSRFIESVLLVMLLGLCVACTSENDADTDYPYLGPASSLPSPQVRAELSAAPLNVQTGATVEFTVDATATRGVITESLIDFETNGSWDESQAHDSASISARFRHAYLAPGYSRATVRVVARYTDGGTVGTVGDTAGLYITVTDPARFN
jgi:hypothetical protein